MPKSKELTKIKTSLLGRSLSLAKLTVQTGSQMLGHKIKEHLTTQKEKSTHSWEQILTDNAALVANEFGKLKGSILKAGQLLSMYGEYFLPPKANEFLKSLQSQSPPLAFAEIFKVLKRELPNQTWEEWIVDPNPIGTASLAQVHRAQNRFTKKWIAFKVQYPGVKEAIAADLSALKHLMKLSQLLPKSPAIDSIFEEIKTMMYQELDYEREIEELEKYQKRLQGDERFLIPCVLPELCSPHVIATEYLPGLRADSPEVQNLSEERRSQIGFSFLDLYFKELFEWGVVQTDPHLGNYAIRLKSPHHKQSHQDQIILYDFGAVRQYPQDFLSPYYQMIWASLHNDSPALRKAATQLKFIDPHDPEELVHLFESFCLQTVEPFLDPKDPRVKEDPAMLPSGSYQWAHSTLPQRLTHIGWNMIRRFEFRAPPPEILFLDRKTGGVFIFLKVLRSCFRGRELLYDHLQKALHTLRARDTQ
ncbi:MAG: AarF/ABC1/UbiB kinase family protein [Bdellovibrionaceae bacterium]|nr:AarF/ABC1/UbiB kinase family protein [Pseudobdellovibrionaceae bacterium]MDW8190174.1 AarF/ABC1/UbiB kinase family protein [Pseudobdellovibrionaceae bacterium]